MPPLTATPTNTWPDVTRGSSRGGGGDDRDECCRYCPDLPDGNDLALACNGGTWALLCEGDTLALLDDRVGETGRGRAAGLPGKDAPLGRLPELTGCAGGSTKIPAQPTASA
jgi:hypothetical protein